ncbi:hypothetical protein ALC62_05117 [Cyphomyrmex costatus]|uniref:Uncharacterized protein n=1 Tax=Cyphomyrmex costatus TaxID=456900 RepID=A0A195CUJ5_9HYME|nr:hypothetical protein ALC62_05117 [Cyphomyrmex costatus]
MVRVIMPYCFACFHRSARKLRENKLDMELESDIMQFFPTSQYNLRTVDSVLRRQTRSSQTKLTVVSSCRKKVAGAVRRQARGE